MKKTFTLLITFILLCPILKGQTEFSKSGSKWIVNYAYSRFDEFDYHSYEYNLGKDTTLLNETWKILHKGAQAIGAFQEEGKKVYYYSFDWPDQVASQKRLFYDFSKEKGDTIFLSGESLSVGYIYSSKQDIPKDNDFQEYEIVYDVKYQQGRKVIDIGRETWIEGIGNTDSFFDRYLPRPTNHSNIIQYLHQVIVMFHP